MKVRSITLGTPIEADLVGLLARAESWLSRLRQRFEAAGFEVQTVRVSLPPLGDLSPHGITNVVDFVCRLDAAAAASGVEYVALGPLRWSPALAPEAGLAAELGRALAGADRVFGTIETTRAGAVDFQAVGAAATVIRMLADSTERGFGNLRFAALANCPPGVPFFPAAYHESAEPGFGLALQAADLALEAFRAADSLEAAEQALRRRVEALLARLETVGLQAERELGLRYLGADPTLAPFPSDDESIGAALERLGVERVGGAGTLSVAALVTRALRSVQGRRCGFAGLMLPVLEDSVLARRAGEGLLGWEKLLLYSAVCGTGLDTVPLPGDIAAGHLAAIVLDVSTLAVTLDKPLTCRLLPVPGLRAGERTAFDFPFFANAAVLEPPRGDASGLLRLGLRSGPA
jgi:uncharacterized protein (UPF0210 family)